MWTEVKKTKLEILFLCLWSEVCRNHALYLYKKLFSLQQSLVLGKKFLRVRKSVFSQISFAIVFVSTTKLEKQDKSLDMHFNLVGIKQWGGT